MAWQQDDQDVHTHEQQHDVGHQLGIQEGAPGIRRGDSQQRQQNAAPLHTTPVHPSHATTAGGGGVHPVHSGQTVTTAFAERLNVLEQKAVARWGGSKTVMVIT
jgi:hypothetical protein